MEKTLKRQRFEKVASSRVQKVIDVLELLKNCSNQNNYEYTLDDVDHMFFEISKKLKETRSLFTDGLNKSPKNHFSFK